MTTLAIVEPWQRATHAEQRATFIESFRVRGITTPPVPMLEILQSVSGLESCYGVPDKPVVWVGSCNHGAIQHKYPPCEAAYHMGEQWHGQTCFSCFDSNPIDGSNKSKGYAVCFRAWSSHLEGVGGLVDWFLRHPKVLAAAKTGDPLVFSTAMYQAHYYTGWGPTPEVRIGRHRDAVTAQIAAQRRAIHDGAVDDYPHTIPFCLQNLDVLALLDGAREGMAAEKDAHMREVGWE